MFDGGEVDAFPVFIGAVSDVVWSGEQACDVEQPRELVRFELECDVQWGMIIVPEGENTRHGDEDRDRDNE